MAITKRNKSNFLPKSNIGPIPVYAEYLNEVIDRLNSITDADDTLVADSMQVDTIAEKTSGGGLEVDGVILKDGEVKHGVTGMFDGAPLINGVKPASMIVFFEDFVATGYLAAEAGGMFSATANAGKWLVTLVDGDSDAAEIVGRPADGAANDSGHGGWGTFTTNDKQAGELVSCQLNGETFKLAVGKALWFETKFAVEDISETQVFIGLADSAADCYAAGAGATNHAGFMLDNDGNLDFSLDEGGTQDKDDTTVNFVDGSLATLETTNVVHTCGFYWDGVDSIYVYVDGTLTNTLTDNDTTTVVPDGTCLTPTIHVESNGASAETIWVDYIYVAQER